MTTKLSPEKAALHRAAAVLGGQAAMAELLRYKDRRGVWPYFNTDRVFPAEHCPIIERATREKGQPVTCEQLRPDVAWDVLREQAVKAGKPLLQQTDKAVASDDDGTEAATKAAKKSDKPKAPRAAAPASSKPKAITSAMAVTEHAKA